MSSIRSNHCPAAALADSQDAAAVNSEPRCSGPVGDGAKRPRYTLSARGKRAATGGVDSAALLALLYFFERLAVYAKC